MNTLRNKLKEQYSQIPNELITDMNLCSGSLRVLLYLFTKPDNWNVYNKDIQKQLNISDKTLAKYWKELLASKWLRRTKRPPSAGKIAGGYVYQIGNFAFSEESYKKEESGGLSNNKPNNKKENIYTLVTSFLNEKVGTRYKANSTKTKQLIDTRIKEGFTLEDFKTVISKKHKDWSKDEKMIKFLRPETLFSNKFESYLNEIEAKEQTIWM